MPSRARTVITQDARPAKAITVDCDPKRGNIQLRLHDAEGKIFAFASLEIAEAALTFGQAQAWCHAAMIGRQVSEQVGRA
jgi:hypothetical protein